MRQEFEPPPPGGGNAGQSAPIINAPAAVVGLCLAVLALHGLRLGLDPEIQDILGAYLAFMPARYLPDAALPGAPATYLSSLLTYGFIHSDWTHAVLNAIWLLAFGTPVCRRIGSFGFLLIFAVTTIAGALLFWAFHPQDDVMLIGASGGVSGLLGAATRFMFRPSYHPEGPAVPLMSLFDRRVLFFVAIWAGMNLLFSLGFGLANDGISEISWEAHAGGFLAGLLVMPLIDRRHSSVIHPGAQ